MAGSRREKTGSILRRMTGLLRSGAVVEEDRPIWFDVVQAFPPKPIPAPQQIQNMLYPEDFIRVHFYKTFVESSATLLTNEKIKSVPQRFVDKYLELQSQKAVPTEQLFNETVRLLKEEGVKLQEHQEKEEAERARRESLTQRQQRDLYAEDTYSKTDTKSVEDDKTSQRPKLDLEELFTEKR